MLGRVEYSKYEVSFLYLSVGYLNTALFYLVVSVSYAGSIGKSDSQLTDLYILLDHVSGRTGNIGNDASLISAEAVHKR